MNQRVFMAAFAALASGSAAAQSNVQVYGVLDAGVEYVSNATASGEGTTRIYSGGANNSRLGFRGTEDLGNGLKAVFNLEAGLLIDQGASDGPLFRRQANVGLEGGFGRVVIGRSFTTVYDFVNPFDPMGYAPRYSWIPGGGATLSSKYGMTTAFDNMVKYTGTSGGFTYGASVGLGERAGNSADDRKYAVGGSWFGGDFGVMAAYEQVNGTSVAATGLRNRTNALHLAADYKAGAWRTTAGLRSYKLRSGSAGVATLRGDTWWGGLTYQVDNITLTGAVYHINTRELPAARDADPTMLVARAMYSLSKRTTLYLSAARAKAKNGQLISLSRDDTGTGDTQTGVTAGIQHRF